MTDEVTKDEDSGERLGQLEAIAKKNRKADVEAHREEVPKEESKVEEVAEPVAEATPEAQPEAPTVQKHKLKVNGKELELTTDELIARAQKVEAADEYLREAAQAFKATKQPEPKAPEPAQSSVEEDDAALARAIQTGTEEEARQAIAKLRARPSQASFSQDDVLRVVDQRLAFQDAARKFQAEYKDVFEDPYLLQLAMNEDKRLIEAGDQRGYWDRFNEIGTKIRAWRDGFKSQPDAQEKQQRKASVTVLPTASARATGKTEEPNPTTSDVLREMAQARRGRT